MKCGYLHHRHFFHPFITKQLPVAYMYISILSVISEYMLSNVCQIFCVYVCYDIKFMSQYIVNTYIQYSTQFNSLLALKYNIHVK